LRSSLGSRSMRSIFASFLTRDAPVCLARLVAKRSMKRSMRSISAFCESIALPSRSRALPLPRRASQQAQSRVKKLAKIDRIERDPRDDRNLEFEFSAPERSGRVIFELSDGRVEIAEAKGGRCAARPRRAVAGAWRARVAGGAQRDRQDDADRDARRPARAAAGKLSTGHNVRVGYLSQHAEELGAGASRAERAGRRAARHRPEPNARGRCWDASCSPARRRRNRSAASPAASADGCRWRARGAARTRRTC